MLFGPSEESISEEASEQTEHKGGSQEVGYNVGRGSITQMHGPSQISDQVDGDAQCCQPLHHFTS